VEHLTAKRLRESEDITRSELPRLGDLIHHL